MTDKPTDYDIDDEIALYDSLGEIPEDAEGFEVECDLEWSGEMEKKKPRRKLRLNPENRELDYVNLDQVREAKRAADAAQAGAANPPWAKSYTAKSDMAQFRHLQRTGVGRAALAEFVTATPKTQAGWIKGKTKPSAANREAIARAYEAVATRASRPIAEAEASRTVHALAQALSAAIQSTTGVPVRIFRPGRFEWK